MAQKQIARDGDIAEGICYNHDNPQYWKGIIKSGANKSYCEGELIARLNDVVEGQTCGHNSFISSSASDSYCEGELIARIGDDVVGNGIVAEITSSANKSFCE